MYVSENNLSSVNITDCYDYDVIGRASTYGEYPRELYAATLTAIGMPAVKPLIMKDVVTVESSAETKAVMVSDPKAKVYPQSTEYPEIPEPPVESGKCQ